MTTETKPLNSRQRRFVLNTLAGMPPQQAYELAGYSNSPGNLTVSPYKIVLENPRVKAELERLFERQKKLTIAEVEKTIMQPAEVKAELSKLARANLIDFLDENSQPVLNKEVRHNAAAKEFYHRQRVDHNGNPIITKSIKLHDKVEALRELAKIHGMYAPSKHLVGHKVQFEIAFVDKRKAEPELPEGKE